MTRPLIGVTLSRRSAWRSFPFFALNIWMAGGRAVKWRTAGDVDIDAVDGIVIGGGDDTVPALHDGEVVSTARLDRVRDTMETWILESALRSATPVLCVCRGAQLLNVVSGGTLFRDAQATAGGQPYRTILPRKTLAIKHCTRLISIVGPAPMRVNALDAQPVATLGRGLRVAARDQCGMVQAIERIHDPFAIGVQWHPERIFYVRRHRKLFAALVVAARASREDRNQFRLLDAELEKVT